MIKHIALTGCWFAAGAAIAVGLGVTDGALIVAAGALWVMLFG